ILYRCSLYTRSLASTFREPACQRRARSNLRWEGPEELLLTIGRRPRETHVRLPLHDRSSPKSGSPSAVLLCRKRAQSLPCPLPPRRVVDVAYPSSRYSGTCRSPPFSWRQVDAVGRHLTQTLNFATVRIACPRSIARETSETRVGQPRCPMLLLRCG